MTGRGNQARGSVPPSVPRHDQARALLRRLQSGDANAAAEFMLRNEAKIRRRFRGQISRTLQRVFDMDDLLSTITRRFHELVVKRNLEASTQAELWSLINHIARNATSDYAQRLEPQSHPPEKRPHIAAPAIRAWHAEPKPSINLEHIVKCCLTELQDRVDYEIVRMRIQGRTHAQVAAGTGVSVSAVRKRWERICKWIRASA